MKSTQRLTELRTYLTQTASRLPRVAFFLTGGDRVQDKPLAQMAGSAGKQPQATLAVTSIQVDKGDHASEVKQFIEALKAWRWLLPTPAA